MLGGYAALSGVARLAGEHASLTVPGKLNSILIARAGFCHQVKPPRPWPFTLLGHQHFSRFLALRKDVDFSYYLIARGRLEVRHFRQDTRDKPDLSAP